MAEGSRHALMPESIPARHLEPQDRSFSDVLRGHQTYTVVAPVYGVPLNGQDMEFTATLFFERGGFRGPIELDSRQRRE
jgi:hypothetical protein